MARNNIKKLAKQKGYATDNATLGKLFEMESWRIEAIIMCRREPELSEARFIAKKLEKSLNEVFPE